METFIRYRKKTFNLQLSPTDAILILSNYKARAKGLVPDKPYWVDYLAKEWGYNTVYVDWDHLITSP